MAYGNLRAEMAREKVSITEIAEFLGVRFGTVSDKLNGRSRFFVNESIRIKYRYFPDKPIEYLFDSSEKESNDSKIGGLHNAIN